MATEYIHEIYVLEAGEGTVFTCDDHSYRILTRALELVYTVTNTTHVSHIICSEFKITSTMAQGFVDTAVQMKNGQAYVMSERPAEPTKQYFPLA